jgi:ParB family chromosome partitioning protein
MSKSKIVIRPIKERRFAQIPIDKIVVINSRQRDEEHFEDMIRSISELGLYNPICVNSRRLKKTGKYDLVYGEGRLEAYRRLGKTHIEADVVNISEEQALLAGLAENLTRAKKNVIEFARIILQMHKRGMNYSELAKITGKSSTTMADYIALMQKGEERLIRGVEKNLFSISFAMKVIESTESDIQHFLMDAYEQGEIAVRHLESIMKLLNERAKKGLSNRDMTVRKLQTIVKQRTKETKMFIAEAKVKRNDAMQLTECLVTLWEDEEFMKMTDGLKDLPKPELKGQYGN